MNIARGAKAHLLLIGNISKYLDYNLLYVLNMRVYTRAITFINQALDFHITPPPFFGVFKFSNTLHLYICACKLICISFICDNKHADTLASNISAYKDRSQEDRCWTSPRG